MVTTLILDLVLSFGVPVLLLSYTTERISGNALGVGMLVALLLFSAKWVAFEDYIKKGARK